jgi:hypothetical protein
LAATGILFWTRDTKRQGPENLQLPSSMPAATESPTVGSTAQKLSAPTAIPFGDGVEICGVGKLSTDPEDLQDIQSRLDSGVEKIRRQWIASMLHSGDLRARATGLLYESIMSKDWFRAGPSEETAGPLGQLAQSAQDPAVYAMAVYACKPPYGAPPYGGSCDNVSVKEWAALDTGNAVPWLILASEARVAKDSAAENAALAKAANASKIDSYGWALLANVEANMPSSATPLERYMLSTGFIGFEAALAQPSASQSCSAASMADATIRSECGALAELMVSKGTTFLDVSVGAAIGARAGWPAQRVAALKERLDAFRGLTMEQQGPLWPKDQWTCNAINRADARIRDWIRFGEIGALDQELERSGSTTAELAGKYREFQAEMIRKAQDGNASTVE